MHETISERLTEKIYGGAPWEIKYYKNELKNADRYMKTNRRIIESYKKKYPHDWKKRIGMWKMEENFYKHTKADSKAQIKRWQAIQKAHEKMRKVI